MRTRNVFCIVLLASMPTMGSSQKQPKPVRVWSVGPLTKSEPVMGISFGPSGGTITGPHVDSQTGSIFAATRSVAFAGNRVVVASRIGMRTVDGAATMAEVYSVLSLDATTGEVKDKREFLAFGSLEVFGTEDAHIILSGRQVVRLTSDLKGEDVFDYQSTGNKFGKIENISPDGSTLGNATSPGFEFVDSITLKVTPLTKDPVVATSVSNIGIVTNNLHWIRDFPDDKGFVTYYGADGQHLLYHGTCSGRPQFLTEDLILVPGCNNPPVIDTKGKVVRNLKVSGAFSFAGVSRNGLRFALQQGIGKDERFKIYSVETGEPLTELKSDQAPNEQSWTAFSEDGSMFIVGSPLKLTLYRLP